MEKGNREDYNTKRQLLIKTVLGNFHFTADQTEKKLYKSSTANKRISDSNAIL